MTEREGYPRQVVTAETLTRGDAIRAADEWTGRVRHDTARRAEVEHFDDIERSYIDAQSAADSITEVPPDSKFPNDAELCWKMRVQLHAAATGITPKKQMPASEKATNAT